MTPLEPERAAEARRAVVASAIKWAKNTPKHNAGKKLPVESMNFTGMPAHPFFGHIFMDSNVFR